MPAIKCLEDLTTEIFGAVAKSDIIVKTSNIDEAKTHIAVLVEIKEKCEAAIDAAKATRKKIKAYMDGL